MDIKQWLLNPYTALGFSAVLLVGGGDFVQRVKLPTIQDSDAQHMPVEWSQEQLLPVLDEQQKAQLLAQYDKYDAQARKLKKQQSESTAQAKAKPSNQPDQAKIDAQQGELLTVLTNSGRIALRGVIKDGDSYALIEKSDHQGKFENIVRLRLGDQLDGFAVIRFDLNSITLKRESQQITLLMYKRK